MCKVIVIGNQKGGVGKTTTTSNLGIGLAKKGKKVLLIDADAQGSLTASLGFQEPDKLDVSLATIMANIINEEDMEPDYGILKHDEGVDLMPGNIELSGLEVSLVNVMSRELVLRTYIEQQKERYDYILIDCMPSLGMITINAFASADSILIPVQAAYLPVKGLEQLIKTIGKVKRQINPKLEIEGILLTMVDNRTNYAKDISALVVENYGSKVRIFENSIPMSVRAAEISAEGVSIYEHDPNGKVASAYQSLTEEVLADGLYRRTNRTANFACRAKIWAEGSLSVRLLRPRYGNRIQRHRPVDRHLWNEYQEPALALRCVLRSGRCSPQKY